MPTDPALDPLSQSNPDLRLQARLARLEEEQRRAVPALAANANGSLWVPDALKPSAGLPVLVGNIYLQNPLDQPFFFDVTTTSRLTCTASDTMLLYAVANGAAPITSINQTGVFFSNRYMSLTGSYTGVSTVPAGLGEGAMGGPNRFYSSQPIVLLQFFVGAVGAPNNSVFQNTLVNARLV